MGGGKWVKNTREPMSTTRAEILSNYEVDKHGTITSPGKFETQPLYAPHFWELALEGEGEEEFDNDLCRYVSIIKVEPWDTTEYPELIEDDVKWVQIWEDEQGFVILAPLESARSEP